MWIMIVCMITFAMKRGKTGGTGLDFSRRLQVLLCMLDCVETTTLIIYNSSHSKAYCIWIGSTRHSQLVNQGELNHQL